jgi:hypothetical protein
MEKKSGWEKTGQEARELINATRVDDAAALAAASDKALWAADALAANLGGEGRAWGLAGLAAQRGSKGCLEFLLGSDAWLAGHCSLEGGVFQVETELAGWATRAKAEGSLAALAGRSAELAWMSAALCAPGDPWTERHGRLRVAPGHKDKVNPGQEYVSGFKAAALAGVGHGAPASALAKELSREALTRALEEPWAYCAWSGACHDVASAALAQGWLDEGLAVALGNASTKVGEAIHPAHERLWALTVQAFESLGLEIQCSPKALGEAPGWRRLTAASYRADGPMVNFPERLDPAWAAAALASGPKDVEEAVSMASTAGRLNAMPRCEADGKGVEHPLGPIWEAWRHSSKAGFALPKKALEASVKKSEAAFESAKKSAPKEVMDQWRKQAGAMMDELKKGSVPLAFDALGSERPTMEMAKARGQLESGLSPLTWRMSGHAVRAGKERFVAVAAAQSALGFSLEESLAQMEMVGLKPPGRQWLVEAEAEVLRVASLAGPAGHAKGARPRL